MKHLLRSALAAVVLAATATSAEVNAANVDNTTGESDGIKWEYWNDVKVNGEYVPNWRFSTADKTLNTTYTGATVTYTLTSDGTTVKSGNATTSWFGDPTSAYISVGVLDADKEYVINSSVTFKGNPGVTFSLDPVTFTAAGPDLSQVYMQSITASGFKATAGNAGTINFQINASQFDNLDHFHVWAVRSGNVMLGEMETTDLSGVLDLSDMIYKGVSNVWVKVEAIYKDGKKSATVQSAQLKLDTSAFDDGTVMPTIKLTVGEPVATGATTGLLPYTLAVTGADNVTGYKIWVVTNGDKKMGELTTTELSGNVELTNLNEGGKTDLWVKVQAILADGGNYPSDPIQYPGEAQGWTGLSINTFEFGDGIVVPNLVLWAGNGAKTGDTTGTLEYRITSDDSLDDVTSYRILVVTNGDKQVGLEEAATEPVGTIELSGLTPDVENELWVKVVATCSNGKTTDQAQYPGAAQGWWGLSINMAVEAGYEVPELTLKASNPVATSATEGTVDYEITATNAENVDHYIIWVVTNGEKELGRIDNTTEPVGTIELTGLAANSTTELWVKASAVCTNDFVTPLVQYPGEAQGWTGLSIVTPEEEGDDKKDDDKDDGDDEDGIESIAADGTVAVEYYDLQGRRVERPTAGLYIVRLSNGTVAKQIVK